MNTVSPVIESTYNKVLSQTYGLLSTTLLWSALVAFLSIQSGLTNSFAGLGSAAMIGFMVVYFGLLFAIEKTKNSGWGLFWTFALTGVLGVTISPLISFAIGTGQSESVVLALGGTGLIFFMMSAYGKTTNKDLSSWSKLLMFGILGAFILSLLNVFFFQASMIAIIVSIAFAILSSMLIAYQIQAIIKGGETNYISAAVTLFVSIYNIFSSLLHLLLAFGGEE